MPVVRRTVARSVAQTAVLSLLAGRAAAQDTCTYKGPDQGFWNNAGNWTCGVVPANANGQTYNAIIPVNLTVNFDLPGYTELTGFNLSSNATLKLDGQQLKVLGVAVQAGIVSATGPGTQYLAPSQFSTFQNNARAFVKDGAEVTIAAPAYAWTAGGYGTDLFRADGPGAVLELPSLASLNAAVDYWNGQHYYTIAATDGGLINLSGLVSLVGATGDEWLRFHVGANSEVRLDKLKTSTGRVFFDVEVPSFTLPLLQSLSSGYIQVEADNQFNLPAASQVDGSYLELKANGVLSAPKMTSLTGSTLSTAAGSAIHAPLLTDFRGSVTTINPGWTLDAPSFVKIDNARIHVGSGAHFKVVAPSYAWTAGGYGADLFRADGAGSLLDLASVTSFSASAEYWNGQHSYTVAATDGGVVDLSNVATMTGAYGDEWLRLLVGSNGKIRLSQLKTSNGRVWFHAEGASLSAPAMESAETAYMQVSIFNTIHLPALKSLVSSTLAIEDGGAIDAPNLTDFRNSYVNLNQSRFLIAPPFEQIDNARIYVNGGASFAVAALSYAWTAGGYGTDLFRADGPGSLLDLSSLTAFSGSSEYWNGQHFYNLVATGGGVIDLSRVATVTGAYGDEWLSLDALSGGSLLFGSVELQSGRTRLRADTIDSSIAVAGDLTVNGTGLVSLTLVASMYLGGDFAFSATDETWINLADGKLVANGAAPQTIEVGGADLGLPSGAIPPNFQAGQLSVGTPGQKSKVILADSIDNGNRGPNGEPELLYLQGFPADDGLRLLNGSDLVLNDIQVYAVIGNQWVHINELVPDGQASVAFDEGRIWLADPGECFPDMDGSGGLDIFDFLGFVNRFNAQDPDADCTGDGAFDLFDFLCFTNSFNAGC